MYLKDGVFDNINNVVKSVSKNFVHKTIVSIPDSVKMEIDDRFVFVSGALGKLTHMLSSLINIELNNKQCLITYVNNISGKKNGKALVGTTCSLIHGMIVGVTLGYTRTLQLIGIGYRVTVQNNNIINLIIGLSHPVNYSLPSEVTVTCPNQTEIILNSINKQLIGQVAADLRGLCPPEPFKGKGIRYVNEMIYLKDTKKR